MSQRRAYVWSWTFVWALTLAGVVALSMNLSQGHFGFTLDDPYIHLAVAENILRGGYGINSGEYSSPSSSILFPILLAGTEALHLGPFGPFAINALAAGFSVWLLLDFYVSQTFSGRPDRWFPNLLAPTLILSLSAVALPMTGMEHCLHVLAVVVTMRGLVVVVEGGKVPTSLMLAVVAMPLIRFEGLALTIALLGVLVLKQKRRLALRLALLIGGLLAIDAAVMLSLGLPLLPSSVLVKSQGGPISALANAIVRERFGLLFALVIGGLFIGRLTVFQRRSGVVTPEVLVGSVMAFALAAHLVGGRYGWFSRYEVYAVAMCTVGGIYVFRRILSGVAPDDLHARFGFAAVMAVVVAPYLLSAKQTPLASRWVYEQQYQMHRFAVDYFPHPVAVNDLGWTSYRNDNYVLDLWGLGSEKVRKLRQAWRLDSREMKRLVDDSGVDFAMLYPEWFGESIPAEWCLLAVLTTRDTVISSSSVNFYATRPGAVASMDAALDRFVPTLPQRVRLSRLSCGKYPSQPTGR